jgi:hypothetical protein
VIALGLALAAVSAVAINGGYRLQHAAASALPPLALRRPVRSFASLAGNRRWLLGFLAGVAGWAASAGGIGVLALGGGRLVAREQVGVGAALVGLLLLASSLGADAETAHGVAPAVAAWLAVSALSAAAAARTLPGGAGLGTAAGVLYAAGDVATKAAVGGGARLWFVPVLLACHGVAFVCMQLAFQRGGRLATAGLAVLWTNALPIVAGSVLFSEALPGGWRGAARIAAFALVVLGAVALGRPEGGAPVDAPRDAVRLSID